MSTGINIKKKLAILDEGASVTTDATSIDFVGSGVNASTVDGDVTVTIPGGSGNTTYYLNQTVNQAPYKEFSSIVASAVEQVIPLTVLAGATSVIAEYQTPSNIPGTTQIPGGLWQFFLHFNAVAAGQNWIIRPTVYKRDLGGTETLIFTPDPEIVTAMSTTTTMYVCDGVFLATTLLTTDRIVVRISMQNTTGVSQTVNFRTEGSQHYSVGLTTLNQVIPTGAVTSVTGTAPIVSSGGLTPAISIAQASAIADGYLSSSDFAVFDAKVGGSGTINYVSKFTGTGTLGDSNIFDNGTNVGIGTITPAKLLDVNGDALINGHTVGRGGGNVATNTVAGLQSGLANTTGSSNSFFGSSSGRFNTTGINLSSIGVASLYNNTTGSDNVGLGLHTLFSNVTGSNNTSAGNFAGRFLNNGSSANTTPENSVFLGYSTRSLTNNDTNQIVIGYLALGKGSNTVQLGNTSITDTYLQGAVTFNNAYKLPTVAPTSGQVLGYLGAGTTQWTTAGLSYFTEAQATTGVNATVYANSLTAVSTTVSADFVIQAKGNGSIVNVIPDGTATGGNKRGTKCLDLQTSRTSAARIAGGTGNVILNGVDNYITSPTAYSVVIGQNSGVTGGGNSLVVGDSCQMSGTNSLAVGSCTVTGNASASIGGSTVSGGNSLAVGAYGSVSGTFCIGAGRGYVIDGFYSAGFGLGAKNYGHSTRVVNATIDASGNAVDYQGSWFQLAAYTTSATATLLYSYNGSNTSSIDLQNNNLMRIKGMIIGKQVSSVNSAIFDVDVTVVRGATVGTVAILGTPSISLLANTGGFGTPTITISSSGIDFKVIGLAATTIKWSARLDSVEVIA